MQRGTEQRQRKLHHIYPYLSMTTHDGTMRAFLCMHVHYYIFTQSGSHCTGHTCTAYLPTCAPKYLMSRYNTLREWSKVRNAVHDV